MSQWQESGHYFRVRSGWRQGQQPNRRQRTEKYRSQGHPWSRLLRRHVHRQHHGVGNRGSGNEFAQQLRPGGCFKRQKPGQQAGRKSGAGIDRQRHQATGYHDAQGLRECRYGCHQSGRIDQCRTSSACNGECCWRGACIGRFFRNRSERSCACRPEAEREIFDG